MGQPLLLGNSQRLAILERQALAHKQGYSNIYSIAAPTPISTRYNAWLREYFAYISAWLLDEY
ncbi:hypothetical protein BFG52_02920 [Acinetobacter larvae]|uniref:Uncharacterized protein n=1 Tax=Acinetobacter larvae TaxID=1789224 RepID=A0A1B2LWT8_9GAMM|nr:hypothetical protein BFG52_02920 [Acinetobacter larvae]